jgi:hypothetical protein
MGTVTCLDCKEDLDELPSLPSGKRTPCPKCGSTRRAYEEKAQVVIGNKVTAGHALTCGDTGRLIEGGTPEQQKQEGLILDWLKYISNEECLAHLAASKFCSLIHNNPIIKDRCLVLSRGRNIATEMAPTVKPKGFGPPEETKPGRYSIASNPVLYLSTSEQGVFYELKSYQKPGQTLFCQKYNLPTNELKIADFSPNNIDNFIQLVFYYAERGLRNGTIDKGDYVFSQVVAELVKKSGFDGMVIPGVRGTVNHRYSNIVIFDPSDWEKWIDYLLQPSCIDNILEQN